MRREFYELDLVLLIVKNIQILANYYELPMNLLYRHNIIAFTANSPNPLNLHRTDSIAQDYRFYRCIAKSHSTSNEPHPVQTSDCIQSRGTLPKGTSYNIDYYLIYRSQRSRFHRERTAKRSKHESRLPRPKMASSTRKVNIKAQMVL